MLADRSIVSRKSPNKATSVTILVSAEGIRTDLSGLALAEDYNYHVRKKKVRNRVQAELRQLAKTDISGTVDVSFRGVAHKAAILGFAGLGIVNPWFLGLSGLAAAQYGSDWLRLRRRQFQLIEDFREFCREF